MRREILQSFRFLTAAVLAPLMLGACVPASTGPAAPTENTAPATNATVAATSGLGATRCSAPAESVPSLTEGPYFKPGSPERTSLIEPGIAGEQLMLSGFVFDAECAPLPGAELDFWQADGNGAYDNSGFRLRGHQFADAAGAYVLETVVPGFYPGRTEHIHVKVRPQGGAVLTTQLFFPGVAGNQTDRIFDPRLVIQMVRANEGWVGTFDFIVAAH